MTDRMSSLYTPGCAATWSGYVRVALVDRKSDLATLCGYRQGVRCSSRQLDLLPDLADPVASKAKHIGPGFLLWR